MINYKIGKDNNTRGKVFHKTSQKCENVREQDVNIHFKEEGVNLIVVTIK